MSLAEQVALAETANDALKSENASLTNKLSLANAEVDRLQADNERLSLRLEHYIQQAAKMQTLISSAGVLLVEGQTVGEGLTAPRPRQSTAMQEQGLLGEVG